MAAPATTADATTRRRLEGLLGVPFTTGNRVDVLRNGVEVLPAMLQEIDAAARTLDLLWFVWGRGHVTEQVAGALARAARRGVRVRVMLDAFGAKGIAGQQVRTMRAAGCQVEFFHPLRSWRITTLNLRSHRRVLLRDETVGITGGTGIDAAWTGDAGGPADWRDTAVRITGPAVNGLRAAFAADWLQTERPPADEADRFPDHGSPGDVAVQVLAPTSQPGWNASALALLTLLDVARERVRIATPYSRLTERFHRALDRAVARGVQVQLLVPGQHIDRRLVDLQARHEFARLLGAGVELWLYQPTMLHEKVVTVDRTLSLVGTTNLDTRSLALNEQVALVVDDAAVTGRLDEHLDDDLAHSERLTAEQWRRRGARERVLETLAGTLAKPLRGLGGRGLTGPRP